MTSHVSRSRLRGRGDIYKKSKSCSSKSPCSTRSSLMTSDVMTTDTYITTSADVTTKYSTEEYATTTSSSHHGKSSTISEYTDFSKATDSNIDISTQELKSSTTVFIDSTSSFQNKITSITDNTTNNEPLTTSGTMQFSSPFMSSQQTMESIRTSDALMSNISTTASPFWTSSQTMANLTDMTTLIGDYDDITDSNSSLSTEPITLPEGIVYYIIVYGGIVLSGMLFNILAIIAIAALSKLRTAHNIFVLNLCLADILLGVNAMFAFIAEIDASFSIEDHAQQCQILGFITFIPPIAVVLSMTVIARNRYKAIAGMHSKNVVFSRQRVAVYLVIVWLISILVASPILIADMEIRTGLFCTCCFYFSENKPYGFTVTVFAYLIPNYIIVYSYICIFIIFYKSKKRIKQQGNVTSSSTSKHGDIRLAVQFILLFAIFNICYLPTMIVFWMDQDSSISNGCMAFIMILFACTIIANPISYFIMNKTAKQEIKRIFCLCKSNSGKVSDINYAISTPKSGTVPKRTQVSNVPEWSTPKTLTVNSRRTKVPEFSVMKNDSHSKAAKTVKTDKNNFKIITKEDQGGKENLDLKSEQYLEIKVTRDTQDKNIKTSNNKEQFKYNKSNHPPSGKTVKHKPNIARTLKEKENSSMVKNAFYDHGEIPSTSGGRYNNTRVSKNMNSRTEFYEKNLHYLSLPNVVENDSKS